MKFFASVLALMASSARAANPPSAADLLKVRWDMDEPNITYTSENNTFTLDFPTASQANDLDGLQEEFYDVNCKDDGSGFPEKVISGYFKNPGTGGRPVFNKDGPGGDLQLQFIVDTQLIVNDTDVYEVVGQDPDLCMGQYWDFTVSFNDTLVVSDVDDYSELAFVIKRRIDNQVMAQTTNPMGITGGGYYEWVAPGLCRGVDYIFEVTDSGADGLNNDSNFYIEGIYKSDVDPEYTPDTLWEARGDEFTTGFTALFNLPLNPQNPATNIDGREGQGMVKFCVRSSIGYNGTLTESLSLADQISNGYQEVNFIESLITIFYDLTAGFTVLDFNVDPKERVETTFEKDTYGLIAWLCPLGADMYDIDYPNNPGVRNQTVPVALSDEYLTTAPDADKKYFNQGALITVCVRPDQLAWIDGIRMNGITSFTWERDDLNATAAGLPANERVPIRQEAIVGGGASGNGLTSYVESTCEGGKDYCQFSSILFADFYISKGAAGGFGNANLIFAAPGTRRLGAPEEERRQLQDGASDSPFDVTVPVDLTDTGPAGLKTAAGVSFTTSTLTLAMALLGAVLLA